MSIYIICMVETYYVNFMRMVLSRFFHQNLFAFAKSISTRFSCKPFCMQSVSLEPFCLYSVVAEAGHVQTRHLQQMTCSDVIGRNDAQSKALDPLGGKAWVQVANASDYSVGDILKTEDLEVKVIDIRVQYVQLDRLLGRRQASRLTKSFTTADPHVWCPHFLDKWAEFWNGDFGDEENPEDAYLHLLPEIEPNHLVPLTWTDWVRALKSAKSSSMRGIPTVGEFLN